jgi:hypothetical protein
MRNEALHARCGQLAEHLLRRRHTDHYYIMQHEQLHAIALQLSLRTHTARYSSIIFFALHTSSWLAVCSSVCAQLLHYTAAKRHNAHCCSSTVTAATAHPCCTTCCLFAEHIVIVLYVSIHTLQNSFSSGRRAMPLPSAVVISHSTPHGAAPASLAKSSAASVCPALARTPPC